MAELVGRFIASDSATAYHVGRSKELLKFWAEVKVKNVNKGLAEEYRNWRHRQKCISDATINRDLSVLRHTFNWALDNSLLGVNPLNRLRLVRERRTKKTILAADEEELLLCACAPHFAPIVAFTVDTGMRRGEVLKQQWSDIDLKRKLLFVTSSKTPEGESREIPFTNRVSSLLSHMNPSHSLVFTFRGEAIRNVKRAWKSAVRRSGIRPLRFHDLRHTFNTRLMEAGVIQDIRKALMGHSTGDEVHAAYTHVELPAKREAIRKLELWLAAQRQMGREEITQNQIGNVKQPEGSMDVEQTPTR
ncbi:MAG: site-specific integrase [Acidobacteriales bacterium]|nr:site-specific integrase [Terriglobales bacterium]